MRLLAILLLTTVGCNPPCSTTRTNWDYHHEHPECKAEQHFEQEYAVIDGKRRESTLFVPRTLYSCPDGTGFEVADSEAKGRP